MHICLQDDEDPSQSLPIQIGSLVAADLTWKASHNRPVSISPREARVVHVQFTAQLKVQGGPALAVRSSLEPESYAYASITRDAARGTDASQELPQLPSDGDVLLLGHPLPSGGRHVCKS